MDDLIARLEAAESGSDELSAHVMMLFRAPDGEVKQSSINGAWCIYSAPGRLLENSRANGWWREHGWPVTTSLDAALALADRAISRRGPIDMSICGSAQVVIHHHDPCGNPLSSCFGKSPALALCIAILRATPEKSNG